MIRSRGPVVHEAPLQPGTRKMTEMQRHVLQFMNPAAVANAAAILCLSATAAYGLPGQPETAARVVQANPILQRPWDPCKPKTSCVSTNSIMSPAQYMPPWSFVPDSKHTAFKSLLGQLQELHAVILISEEEEGYITAQVKTGSGVDTLQLMLGPDGVVLFKSQSSVDRPDPPFCLTAGCISGPSARGRLNALRNALGWTVLETDEDKEWVQILLH